MAGRNIFLIGISGASNSGKTSLTSKLVKAFPGIIKTTVSQDAYFYDPGDKHHTMVPELQVENYELITSLDMERMVKDVKELKEKYSPTDNRSKAVILVEGFIQYSYKPLTEMFDRKYFMTISEDICKERRRHRHYIPADIPGYFEKVVWPAYVQYLKDVQPQTDIIYLDGDVDQDRALQQISIDIQNLLKAS